MGTKLYIGNLAFSETEDSINQMKHAQRKIVKAVLTEVFAPALVADRITAAVPTKISLELISGFGQMGKSLGSSKPEL